MKGIVRYLWVSVCSGHRSPEVRDVVEETHGRHRTAQQGVDRETIALVAGILGTAAVDHDMEVGQMDQPGGDLLCCRNARPVEVGPEDDAIRETLQVAENFSQGELLGFGQLRTHAGRGADTYVASQSEDPQGSRAELRSLRKGGSQQEHIYLRFDLSKAEVAKDAFDHAVLLLSVQPGGLQGKSILNVYGIQSRLEEEWKESGDGSLTWNNAPCRDGIGGQKYLGQLVVDNAKDHLSKVADGVRFFSNELDDFVRNAPGDLVTIVLIRESVADAATLFKSKEGKPSEAPALALRPKRPAAP